MKVAVFFAAICIFALVMPQAYAEEEEETAVREVRAGKAPVMCAAKCQYDSCKKICMHCAICYCSNHVYAPVMCAAKCQYDSCKKICMHCAICYCSNHVYGQCKCCD
ncbi:hypothetical protein NP493_1753g00020 [Ridgeia piscesae]|uniref:Uncharacterized protein n=1 Tax=Ridgeia piscesae TaxID=27915 RepID=A0AAD9JTE8_RIDPI|nr:hypothetical protein NP493_1753g00020 [Ridgeia piscesae]